MGRDGRQRSTALEAVTCLQRCAARTSHWSPVCSAAAWQGPLLTRLSVQAVRAHTLAPDGDDCHPAPALLAALSSVHTFLSSPVGIEAACREAALVVALREALHGADEEGKRIVVEVLCKLCIYSARSYRLALQASLFG